MVYETLGNVSDLQVVESVNSNEVRLSGVFGVCGVRNNNKRVYNKQNYGMMVEALQKVIKAEGCPGELEHPNSMNITLENVSHKIESIQMNEDGTITGTILLLNTPKGMIAKAIIEGGLPLYISSRGAGSIDENGNVTLSSIKTYDLVGTPGFSQAKLTLKENQTYECLNESMDEGNVMFAIVENDEFGFSDDDKKEKKKDDKDSGDDLFGSDDKDSKDDDKDSKDDKDSDDEDSKDDEDSEKSKEKKTKKDDDISMKDLKNAIDKLTEKINSVEAQLHVANESLTPNYAAIEQWICEEFAPEFKTKAKKEILESVKQWTVNEFAPEVQNWVCEEFAPEVQGWITEEFAPEVQNWVCEEFAPEVQGWICEEFAPEVQGWICEEFAPEVQNWVCEEYSATLQNWITEEFGNDLTNNINEFLEEQKSNKFSNIDKVIESLENIDSKEAALEKLTEAQKQDKTFAGCFAIENMPAQYRPAWESLNEARKQEIARQSKMYDFTKQGILESFWAGIKFNNTLITESNDPTKQMSNYHSGIYAQMMKMRH